MTDIVQSALALWDMQGASWSLAAERENTVYKFTHDGRTFALRVKRPGYRSKPELTSELVWMAEMDRAGLHVPSPIRSRNDQYLETLGGRYVDVVTWLEGQPLGDSRTQLSVPNAPAIFHTLGIEMAKLHIACDAWQPPSEFTRCNWDRDGLLGDAPLWGRFWQNPTLSQDTRSLLEHFRTHAWDALDTQDLDTGLIHADLVRENVILNQRKVCLIDFDDGGYGYRLFDIATALLKNRSEPNFTQLQDSLLHGYRSVRQLDTTLLNLFLALRATTYVGWIVPRMAEPGAQQRNKRFIRDAETLCRAYLADV